jgi:CHAD domain-containing protein/CYTH domain-containing protein
VRRVALAWLADARAASTRLDDPEDAKALHDFRVAIRRLRSTLRAWRAELASSVGGKRRRALRALQRATGQGRDAEVALAWLADQRATLAPDERAGFEHLAARLERRHHAAMRHAREEVRRRFEKLDRRLAARLDLLHLDENGEPFGAALAARARDAADVLTRRLATISTPEDRAACHAARIADKRLRYLLEPLRDEAAVGAIVERCKALQDVLGELNDAHVLEDEIQAIRAESSGEALPGLEALAGRNRARAAALFERLAANWLGDGVAALAAAVDALAAELEAGAKPDVEIERKYLLDRLPDLDALRARGIPVESFEVEQGWLPGERLRERVRRTTRAADPRGEARYFRTVKLGAGVERIEIEEPTTAHVFGTLWPLTEGCRIRKRRHCVQDAGRLWEIDEFLDRDLALAEVELPDAAVRPELPSWLEDRVVREVTDDPRYTNLSLARHGAPREAVNGGSR